MKKKIILKHELCPGCHFMKELGKSEKEIEKDHREFIKLKK